MSLGDIMDEIRIKYSASHYGKWILIFILAVFPVTTIALGILGLYLNSGAIIQALSALFIIFFIIMLLDTIKKLILLIFRQEAMVLKEDVFVDKFSRYRPLSISWDDVCEFKIKNWVDQELCDRYTLHITYKNLDKYKEHKDIIKANKNYILGQKLKVEIEMGELALRVKDYDILEKYYYIVKNIEHLDKNGRV